MNWNTFFSILDIVTYPLLGILFFIGVVKIVLGLRKWQMHSMNEQHLAGYDYPRVWQGIQILLGTFSLGSFVTAQHFSNVFIKMALYLIAVAGMFLFFLSLLRGRNNASSPEIRSSKHKEAQPKDANEENHFSS
jgi:hypothetical protein